MSRGSRRLYMFRENDDGACKGQGANEKCSQMICWGSSGDSNMAGEVQVYWKRGDDKPHVRFVVAKGLEYTVVENE